MAYDERLKTAVARLVVKRGILASEVSAQLGISEGSINRWKREYGERFTSDSDDLDDILISAREQVAEAVGVHPNSVKILVDLTPD